jgi:predicted patatin/cPLA2 family phospholipase
VIRHMLIALVGLSIALAGCSIPDRGPVVPDTYTEHAQPLGIPNVRFYADADPAPMIEEATRALAREKATLQAAGQSIAQLPPAYYLAVSGGGDNGAFGAGLMNGWTTTGTRPIFKMVTGVSTGALIAPFVFLGPDHDNELREVYTTLTPDRIFRRRSLAAALFNDAMADTTPLAEVIAKYANQGMFDEIAREYNKGRLLLIGTTDLDAQRSVIWNIGALATSGHPKALDLFRKILRASSAIPGAFEPVLLDVEIDGRRYQEMHVDGGAIAQLFLYPPTIEVGQLGAARARVAYIIRNGRLHPEHAQTERRTINIASRAIATMLAASGQNDAMRTYFVSRRDGVEYNLAYIGADFSAEKPGEFDRAFMQALFDYGYREARDGQAWHRVPPGLQARASRRADASAGD